MADGPVNLFEYEELAKERINKPDYDYIAGGATDEITIRRTRAVLDSIMLRPNMMVDISQARPLHHRPRPAHQPPPHARPGRPSLHGHGRSRTRQRPRRRCHGHCHGP